MEFFGCTAVGSIRHTPLLPVYLQGTDRNTCKGYVAIEELLKEKF
jgi:hypothetical protein